jgi:iron complex outermembrane receptor protein
MLRTDVTIGALCAVLGIAPLHAQQTTPSADTVPIGYGSVPAAELTGSVTRLTPADFNTGRVVSLRQLIQGRIAGVQVADADEPGGAAAIRIRGVSGLGSGEPLYVVDGVPLGPGGGPTAGRDPLAFLNPSDIASITILKDGAAAAIYGGDASNGVVLIETKGAAGGHRGAQLEYSTTVSSSAASRIPAVLTATQFRQAVATYAPARSALLGAASTDWFGLIDRRAPGQQYDAALSNAGETGGYRLSFGYLRQDGVVRGSGVQRSSVTADVDQRFFDGRLDLRAAVTGARTVDVFQAADALRNAVLMAPTQPVHDPASATGYWDWPATGSSASNPVASVDRSVDRATTWRSVGTAQAGYRVPFLDALRVDAAVGYDVAQAERSAFAPSDLADQISQGHGLLQHVMTAFSGSLIEARLSYAAPLRAVPGAIRATGGYASQRSHAEVQSLLETGLHSDLLGVDGLAPADNVVNSKLVVDGGLTSLFGRMAWTLDDRVVVTASVRRDRASQFAPGERWGSFPSVALAWHVAGGAPRRRDAAAPDLTLRVSWGRTGNRSVAASVRGTFGSVSVDPNLHWERTGSWDAGVDFGLAGRRVGGSVEWYTRTTSGLILAVPVASGTTFSNVLVTNAGSARNRGVEATVRARILDGGRRRLGWSADLVVSHNANMLTGLSVGGAPWIRAGAISGGVGNTLQVLIPGQPIGAFYVYRQKYDGDGKPLEGQYEDVNGDGVVNSGDLRPLHSPWPTLEVGHTSRLTFRRWELDVTLRAWLGNYVYDNVASQGSWQALTGGASPSNVPASVLRSGFTAPQYLSDYYVEDASFLRLDAVTLGYTFGSGARRLRVFAAVRNAATITGYRGVDAGAAPSGIETDPYPRSRSFVAGLNIGP